MDRAFTGIKDVDMIILSHLDDRNLLTKCTLNKYVNQLCNDENFWRNRFLARSSVRPNITTSWKRYYLETLKDIDLLDQFFLDKSYETEEARFDFITRLNYELDRLHFYGIKSLPKLRNYLKTEYVSTLYVPANMKATLALRKLGSVENPARPLLYPKMKYTGLPDELQSYLAAFLQKVLKQNNI